MSYSSEDWQDIISNSSSRETVSSVRSLTADPSSEASLQIQEYTDSKVPDHGESIVKSVFPMEKWLPTVKAWRTLTSFASILKQIPSRLVLESNEYRLEGYPTNLEWKKLQAYATTIKELSISDDDPKIPKVADSVYFLLGQCQGTVEPLFPSLSRLRIASTVPTSLPHIFLFFSPALKRVELMGLTDDARAALAIFLRRVGKETSLSHLILESTVSVPEIVKLLVNCRSLEALELRNTKEEWNISSLNSLSHLPKLKCLKLDATTVVNDSYRSADMATPEGQNMLSSIEDFNFTGRLSTLINMASDQIQTSSLRSLYVELLEYHVTTTIRRDSGPNRKNKQTETIYPVQTFFENIVLNAKHLSSLTIIFKPKNVRRFDFQEFIDLSLLHKGSPDLEHIVISGIGISNLDEGIRSLAPHLRKIQTFRFPLANPTGVSLSTLALIAKSCPALISLQVPIAMASIKVPFTPEILAAHPLSILSVACNVDHFGHLPESDDMNRFACTLYALFPNLQQLQGDDKKFLKDVQNLLHTFREISDIDYKRATISMDKDRVAVA